MEYLETYVLMFQYQSWEVLNDNSLSRKEEQVFALLLPFFGVVIMLRKNKILKSVAVTVVVKPSKLIAGVSMRKGRLEKISNCLVARGYY